MNASQSQRDGDVGAGMATPLPLPGSPAVLGRLRVQDAAGLERHLRSRLARLGLARFVAHEVTVLNVALAQWNDCSAVRANEEHRYTDCVASVLRLGISQVQVPVRPAAPRVLLATLPEERHGLGLLMAQSLLALQGCPVVLLGVGMPVQEVAAAARSSGAAVVGLSYNATRQPRDLLHGVRELRGLLDPTVRLWVGASSAELAESLRTDGVRVMPALEYIYHFLAEDFALPPLPAQPSPRATPAAMRRP